ncbi:TetR/AcrR family transcriptional regulator [Actinomadura rugatobispora]|uniref:TetR/AcrR family transcriptional regulator n=1 Tax=Actinomadura rugatobispora TaxID=1994 RepID=A0ABW1A0Y9_9ACTN|nr:hypothetical protein GCM10010200_100920 [Actinomadura rugatobispora]
MGNATRRSEILDVAASLFASTGLRTSLNDIADACGIRPGSLYYHFESKEALIAELVERFHTALEQLATSASAGRWSESAPSDAVVAFGQEIADCAVRHRAALLLSLFDAPAVAVPESRDVAGRTLPMVHEAMHGLLRVAEEQGELRGGLNLDAVADRVCQSMFHVGIGVYHRSRGGRLVPELKCRIILDGLAAREDGEPLDGSDAHRVADQVIEGWKHTEPASGDRAALIRAAARTELAKRGVELTTIRDVAAAAGVDLRAVYRVVSSKEELLISVLGDYATAVSDGWTQVVEATASPMEKLDALLWLNVNVLDRFHEEHRIQTLSLKQIPPTSENLPLTFGTQLRQLGEILAAGDRAGVFRFTDMPADTRARSAFSLVWTPENLVRRLGPEGAHELARDTVLRGIGRT